MPDYVRKPVFKQIDADLWQWGDWFIARACGNYWLLTSAAREFGPFQHFRQAYGQILQLV